MRYRNITNHSEDEIRMRSYLIWDREGRPEGKSEEHWRRAKAELEAEFQAKCAGSIDGKSKVFVVPLLQISSPPTRSQSTRDTPGSVPRLHRAA